MRSARLFTKLVAILLFSLCHKLLAFNIDTQLSDVRLGPAGSHFGFSLEILRDESDVVRLIIGAPRANSSLQKTALRSGAVYDCSFAGLSLCPELDMGVRDDGKPVQIEDQALGFSLAIDSSGPPKVTVCAPLWKNVRIPTHYLSQGRCHEIGYGKARRFTETYMPMRPRKSNNLEDKLFDAESYIKGMGQAGFTVHYTKQAPGSVPRLVVGAPGYYDWRGGLSYIDNTTRLIYEPSMMGEQFQTDSYTSYSMTSGQFSFNRKVSLVTGSPNWNHKGKVLVLERKFTGDLIERTGEQVGSYFGAAVCAVDVNGDGQDDLLVGAPLYSIRFEEGKVYVYASYELRYLVKKTPLEGPQIAGGRFGMAIGNAGDLNNDGFNDVIIGAPFVDTTGVVYVYQGSSSGLKVKPSQSISGKSIDPNLRGFGWSFTQSTDTDNNGYPDLAVGSPLSDRVVSLRTLPVATVEASLEIHDVSIRPASRQECLYNQRLQMCTDVTVTFTYTGKHCPLERAIEFELRADTLAERNGEVGRAQFRLASDELSPFVHRNLTLKHAIRVTHRYTVIVQPRIDRYTDIGFELSFTQSSACQLEPAKCPISDVFAPDTIRKQVPFSKDCGDDEVCVADLVLDAFVPRQLVIGGSGLTIKVSLQNRGEAAYRSTVALSYDKRLTVTGVTTVEAPSGTSVSCQLLSAQDEDQRTMVCHTGNPLPQDRLVQYLLSFDVSELRARGSTTSVSLRASTLSEEKNSTIADNSMVKEISLKMHAELDVYTASLPEQLRYRETNSKRVAADKKLSIVHQYTVSNAGQGTSPEITVTVSIPSVDKQGRKLVHISSVEAFPTEGQREDIDAECDWDQNSQTRNRVPEKIPPPLEGTVYMNCQTTQCISVTCRLLELKRYNSAVISLNGWVFESVFSSYTSEGSIKLQTNATVDVLQHSLLEPGSFVTGQYSVTTDVFGHLTSPSSPWILIGCLGAGLLILVIICIVLWRLGYFKRRQRDDLRRLLEEEGRDMNLSSVSSAERTSPDRDELPPHYDQLGATGGANLDYVVPVTNNAPDSKCDDGYLHPLSVELPARERRENVYSGVPGEHTEDQALLTL